MTRIFEALEQAKQEVDPNGTKPVISFENPTPPSSGNGRGFEHVLMGLYQSLRSRFMDDKGKSVVFLGVNHGEGSSTLIREFALVAAQRLGRDVLLLGADPKNSGVGKRFGLQNLRGWQDAVEDHALINEVIRPVRDSKLSVGQIVESYSTPIFSNPKIEDFFAVLKERYDLVLLDPPAAGISTEGFGYAERADGTVLVVESEKTRWQVADAVRKKIESHGGNVVGVVLNKRRTIIPEFIYKRI